MKNARPLALALALAGAAAQPSHAAVIALDFSGLGPVGGFSKWSLGFEFTANRSITATALGAWDADGDGFAQPQQAGLWDCSGTLLSSAFVDNNSPLEGLAGWRFSDIAPVTLTQGGCYRVASQGGEGFAFDVSGVSIDSAIGFSIARWASVGSMANDPLKFPTGAGALSEYAYFGGNLKLGEVGQGAQGQGNGEGTGQGGNIAAIPLPATPMLFAAGLAGFGLRVRRRA